MDYHFSSSYRRHRLIDGVELIGIVLTHGIVLLTASSYGRRRTHRHRATHGIVLFDGYFFFFSSL